MQKILLTALVAGFLAGLFIFIVQSIKLTPLILQAETYEVSAPVVRMDGEHHHEEGAWEPANGFERNTYRLLADIGVGVGFALMLVGGFALRSEQMDAKRGLLWGVAAFVVFSLATGLGLPPELPATMAADLADRQTWWVATVITTALGLSLIISSANGAASLAEQEAEQKATELQAASAHPLVVNALKLFSGAKLVEVRGS